MANQLAIARKLGITQATVSMALRNHPRISEEMRKRIREAANKLGYRPNPHMSMLMARIREGRSPQNRGCIAILFDAASVDEGLNKQETYSAHYAGYQKQALQHGYRTECFCLHAPGSSPEAIDRRLQARGITGVILADPRRPKTYPTINLRWENYACATVNNTWLEPVVDRVNPNHLHNMMITFEALVRRGCRRIGFCQPPIKLRHKMPSTWMAGYLMAQWWFPDLPKLEPFVGTVHDTSPEEFSSWFLRWKPDGLITAIGDEAPRLRAMGVSLHREGGKGPHIVCLNRPHNSPFPGVDENNELIGRRACETVVNQLTHNQHGPPEHPNQILVPGVWIE